MYQEGMAVNMALVIALGTLAVAFIGFEIWQKVRDGIGRRTEEKGGPGTE